MRICLDTCGYSAFKRGHDGTLGLRILTTNAHFSRLPQVSVLPLE